MTARVPVPPAGHCVLLTEAGNYLCGYAGMPSCFEPNSGWSRGQVASHFQLSREGSPRMQAQHAARAICSDFRPPASGLAGWSEQISLACLRRCFQGLRKKERKKERERRLACVRGISYSEQASWACRCASPPFESLRRQEVQQLSERVCIAGEAGAGRGWLC